MVKESDKDIVSAYSIVLFNEISKYIENIKNKEWLEEHKEQVAYNVPKILENPMIYFDHIEESGDFTVESIKYMLSLQRWQMDVLIDKQLEIEMD